MFKKIFGRPKPSRDYRFAELDSFSDRSNHNQPSSLVRAKRDRFVSRPDEPIYLVEETTDYSTFTEAAQSESFLSFIHRVTKESILIEKEIHAQEIELISKSLGIFSDSKIYSAAIASVLKSYELDIKHFNHPNTFIEKNYVLFDDIDTWIMFISEEEDSGFLDQFLARYLDKPTLFLFSKLEKQAFARQIEQFLKANGLIKSISVESF